MSSEHKEEDALEAPEEEFIELSVWQSENKFRMPEGSKEQPKPENFGLKVVQQTFRGKVMIGVNIMTGMPGHYKRRKKDSEAVLRARIENTGAEDLTEDQSHLVFTALRASSLAGTTMLPFM